MSNHLGKHKPKQVVTFGCGTYCIVTVSPISLLPWVQLQTERGYPTAGELLSGHFCLQADLVSHFQYWAASPMLWNYLPACLESWWFSSMWQLLSCISLALHLYLYPTAKVCPSQIFAFVFNKIWRFSLSSSFETYTASLQIRMWLKSSPALWAFVRDY